MANQEQDCPASLVYRPDICVCGNPLESETESKVVPIPVKSTDLFILVSFVSKKVLKIMRVLINMMCTYKLLKLCMILYVLYIAFPEGVSIFVSYELKTLNDNECKDFYYLYTQIRYDDPSAIYCSDLKGALGCFGVGFFSFHFHFKVSKIALISHSLPNIFRHKLFNFIN